MENDSKDVVGSLLLILFLAGFLCSVYFMFRDYDVKKLPVIQNHHWVANEFGGELYSSDGREAASFIMSFHDSAQICIFEDGITDLPCQHFQDDELALEWLKNEYTDYGKK